MTREDRGALSSLRGVSAELCEALLSSVVNYVNHVPRTRLGWSHATCESAFIRIAARFREALQRDHPVITLLLMVPVL